ncbi:heme A synthase [Pelagovum pacificum]|uniref:Heme A synthase n=1 Tax=Pelagovum pacificum TaxID=2588711 RepID=A0A5C5GCL0_9RHOB|nr:heme A synthase [Pelagovum pacificum]QQA44650.1 COX15/CtaA family protein [Pelagovum pacificum]TNY32240.1 heme A synthase [Pelagovum pacificum]
MAQKPKSRTNRAIFEEVGTGERQVAAATGSIDKGGQGARGAVRLWLMLIFALVAAMILVGGLTRLTDSGLSITEWAPVSGALPPMSEADWQAEFERYQQIPQFTELNSDMDLAGFKSIYWWEWGHRQLGRVIGLVWAIGFFGFLATRTMPRGWSGRLLGLGALGGVQGAIGWWMVHSGLQEGMLSVASYRLAIHLGLAFVIFGFITWYVMRLSRREADLLQARRSGQAKLFSMSTGLMHFAFLQILLGALVAGIDAGRDFPSWPLMAGQIIPPDPFYVPDGAGGSLPAWRAFFENAGLVQFIHRTSGYLLFIFGVIVWLRGRRSPMARTRFAFNAVFSALLLQIVIGIVTVLYAAPLPLGILHQGMAVLLWVLILRARFLARYPHVQSVRD